MHWPPCSTDLWAGPKENRFETLKSPITPLMYCCLANLWKIVRGQGYFVPGIKSYIEAYSTNISNIWSLLKGVHFVAWQTLFEFVDVTREPLRTSIWTSHLPSVFLGFSLDIYYLSIIQIQLGIWTTKTVGWIHQPLMQQVLHLLGPCDEHVSLVEVIHSDLGGAWDYKTPEELRFKNCRYILVTRQKSKVLFKCVFVCYVVCLFFCLPWLQHKTRSI